MSQDANTDRTEYKDANQRDLIQKLIDSDDFEDPQTYLESAVSLRSNQCRRLRYCQTMAAKRRTRGDSTATTVSQRYGKEPVMALVRETKSVMR